jgi:hypothetical protein
MIDSIGNVLPMWAMALVLAAVAPWLVRLLAGGIESRGRRRALLIVERATGSRDARRSA